MLAIIAEDDFVRKEVNLMGDSVLSDDTRLEVVYSSEAYDLRLLSHRDRSQLRLFNDDLFLDLITLLIEEMLSEVKVEELVVACEHHDS